MGRQRAEVAPDALRLLSFVREAAPGPRSATVTSNAQMAEALGCSEAKVKMLKRALLEGGHLEAATRHAENGAQLESAYRLTRKGRRALALMVSEKTPASE